MAKDFAIDFEIARLIDRVFLPKNPNKMRKPHPDVMNAIRVFKHALAEAERVSIRRAISEGN